MTVPESLSMILAEALVEDAPHAIVNERIDAYFSQPVLCPDLHGLKCPAYSPSHTGLPAACLNMLFNESDAEGEDGMFKPPTGQPCPVIGDKP
jgi:hypothetical protein